jgi:Na+/alanine symporter
MWVSPLTTVIDSAFAFTPLMGNYAYSEVNIDFLGGRAKARTGFGW